MHLFDNTYIRQYIPGILLFIFLFAIGLYIYQDYGIAWDEPVQREIGLVSYNYAFKNDTTLLNYVEKDHGVGFELPLVFLEQQMHIHNQRDVYLMRHLVTHLFFLLCCFCGYVLVQNLYKNRLLSCLAFLLFVFHPRIYVHSFYNSKDIPLAGMFLVCFMLAEIAFRKNKYVWYALLGIAIGYATSIRILGIILLVPVLFFFLSDIILKWKQRVSVIHILINSVIFLFSFCIALYIAFPTLWPAPVNSFITVFDSLAHFRWGGKTLFMGSELGSNELPGIYLPVWFGITMPVVWLLTGIGGMFGLIIAVARQPQSFFSNTVGRNYLLYFFCFLFPPIVIVAMHSIVYDDWRHVYFIYPSFVLLCVYALQRLLNAKTGAVLMTLVLLQTVHVIYWMIKNHPHQQVYFNQLVSHKGESLRNNYELDYWGTSYKEGIEYILAHDTSSKVRIFESLPPVANAVMFLPEEQRRRVVFVDRNDFPYYFITNFRNHKEDYTAPEVTGIYYEIKVLNSTILRVYRCD